MDPYHCAPRAHPLRTSCSPTAHLVLSHCAPRAQSYGSTCYSRKTHKRSTLFVSLVFRGGEPVKNYFLVVANRIFIEAIIFLKAPPHITNNLHMFFNLKSTQW